MPRPWTCLASTTRIDAPWLQVREQRLQLPHGHILDPFHWCWEPSWVAALPLRQDGSFAVVEQYRHGIGASTWEFPGGNVDADEDPAAAALREMQEECGCQASGTPRPLGRLVPNPARNACVGHGFLIPVQDHRQAQATDAGEDIQVRWVTASAIEAAIAEGLFCHAAHVAWFRQVRSQPGLVV